MNINFTDLEKLIKLAERSDIHSLEVVDGETSISVVCQSNGTHNNISTNSRASVNHSKNNATDPIANLASQTPANVENTDDNDLLKDASEQIVAPMLGTFYRRSEPSAAAFVEVGDQVEIGQTLCIVEAMKMMHEVKAEAACVIKEVIVDEGDVVEYGQVLFAIELKA